MTDAQQALAQVREALVRRWRYPMLTEEPAPCGESILATVAALWEARTEIERLTAALQHEADCVEAAKAEIERLTDENRRLRADLLAGRNVVNAGLTIHTLTAERDELRRQLAEAEQDARRYRHLVEKHSTEVDDYGTLGITFRCDFEHYNDIDAAIDAAMGLTRPAEES